MPVMRYSTHEKAYVVRRYHVTVHGLVRPWDLEGMLVTHVILFERLYSRCPES